MSGLSILVYAGARQKHTPNRRKKYDLELSVDLESSPWAQVLGILEAAGLEVGEKKDVRVDVEGALDSRRAVGYVKELAEHAAVVWWLHPSSVRAAREALGGAAAVEGLPDDADFSDDE